MSRCWATAASVAEDKRVCASGTSRRAARWEGLSLAAPGWKFGEIEVRGPAWRKDNALAACEPWGLALAAIGVRWWWLDPA